MRDKSSVPISRSEALPQLVAATGGSLMVGILYLIMPSSLIFGPNWLPLVLVLALASPALALLFFAEQGMAHRLIRPFTLTLLGFLTAALLVSVGLLVHGLTASQPLPGRALLKPAALLWVISIGVFAVWYWEVDGDGPVGRHRRRHQAIDFQFPQQSDGNTAQWVPAYIDYFFLAFSTATAFSAADSVPLTPRAKVLMMAESSISLLILVMIVARSVNIL